MITMGAVANGGLLMKPQIVREIRTVDGAVVQRLLPNGAASSIRRHRL